jgi:hypothetical protein
MSVPNDPQMPRYLGDGVYIKIDRGMLCLTTEDGISATNTIYLEPEVWRALKFYVEDLERKATVAKAKEAGPLF